MQLIIKKIGFWASLIIIFLIFLLCDTKSPVNEKYVVVNTSKVSTMIAVDLVDAATGRQIGAETAQEVKVDISGMDKESVTTITGQAVTELNTTCGILNFAVNESFLPSEDNPFHIVLMAQCDGYQKTSLPVTIVTPGGHSYILKMVNLLSPPEGVSYQKSEIGEVADGKVLEEIVFETDPESVTGVSTRIQIPKDVVMTTAKGSALQGKLTAEVLYYNPISEGSCAAFPGGFSVSIMQEDESLVRDHFITYGCVSIRIEDESGKEAQRFSDVIDIESQIPAGLTHFQTGSGFLEGDTIPVWIFIEEYAYWVCEGMAVVGPADANGNHTVIWQSKHLSIFNMDDPVIIWPPKFPPWWPPIPPIPPIINGPPPIPPIKPVPPIPPPCSGMVQITFSSTDGCPFQPGIVKIKRQSDGVYYQFTGYITPSDSALILLCPPCGVPSTLELWSGCPVELIYSQDISDLCSAGEITIDFPCSSGGGAGSGKLTNVPIKIYGYCASEPDVLIGHNTGIWIDDGCGWRYSGRMINGEITLPRLETGQLYSFGIYNEGELYQRSFVVEEGEHEYRFEMPAELCE